MNKVASALTGLKGERIALCDVSVSAVLQDLLAEVSISQTYRNDEPVNIEAVYTFPLPLDAVLLDLEVHIGGRVLKGIVVEKKAAEAKYEDAIEAGDAAVMLEAIEPGLYTMNVGNLRPQETATISFRYAILYRWMGDRLRFFLPTTIAPRYGLSPHLPHRAPTTSLLVENRFSLRVEVFGALREAQFVCPSHAVEFTKSPEKVVISLQQPNAVMDRDFVLTVKVPHATRSFVLCGQDGDGVATLASFQPFFPGLQQPRPLTLAIVIDCSGSMLGDSIEHAKQALESILDGLQPHDRVALIAFGNATRTLSDRLLKCNKTNLATAKRFARALEATMGGTEIGKALNVAYSIVGGLNSADIFLLTDGEVSDWRTVVEQAKRSGCRIFTVGVGSSVAEAFVRELAAATGGECELVSPREGMADRVVRHFERMRAPRAARAIVRWPEGATYIAPSKIGAVFEGDTVIACARFASTPAHGKAILEVETEKGEILRQELLIPPPIPSSLPDGKSTVARVAAAMRLKELDDVVGLETALYYRLASPWTNWLVLAPRAEAEKTREIPALRKVPQTLAAGWGGVGRVAASLSMDALAAPRALYADPTDFSEVARESLPEVMFPRRMLPDELPEPYRRLLELVAEDPSWLDVSGALDLLTKSGVADEFADLFARADRMDLCRDVIAEIVLARLLGGPLGEFVSHDAQAALASLQKVAKEAADALHEMARHGSALARVVQKKVADRLLLGSADKGRLERFAWLCREFAEIRELLDDLEAAICWAERRFSWDEGATARRDRGAIV